MRIPIHLLLICIVLIPACDRTTPSPTTVFVEKDTTPTTIAIAREKIEKLHIMTQDLETVVQRLNQTLQAQQTAIANTASQITKSDNTAKLLHDELIRSTETYELMKASFNELETRRSQLPQQMTADETRLANLQKELRIASENHFSPFTDSNEPPSGIACDSDNHVMVQHSLDSFPGDIIPGLAITDLSLRLVDASIPSPLPDNPQKRAKYQQSWIEQIIQERLHEEHVSYFGGGPPKEIKAGYTHFHCHVLFIDGSRFCLDVWGNEEDEAVYFQVSEAARNVN